MFFSANQFCKSDVFLSQIEKVLRQRHISISSISSCLIPLLNHRVLWSLRRIGIYIYSKLTQLHQKETKNVFIRIYQNYQQDDIYYVRTIHMKDLFGYVKIEKRSLEKQMKSSKRRFTGRKLWNDLTSSQELISGQKNCRVYHRFFAHLVIRPFLDYYYYYRFFTMWWSLLL